MEETEIRRHLKDLHIGRIVIEEIPEEREEVARHDAVQRDQAKISHADRETPYEDENVRRTHVKEEVVKVGRLDVTDYEKTQKESERLKQQKNYFTERSIQDQKVD